MQLSEADEREQNLKKMNENIMKAMQTQNFSPNKSITIEINEDHPQVVEIVRKLKQEWKQQQNQEKQKYRENEYQLEKENQQLQYKVNELQRQTEVLKQDYQNKQLELQNFLVRYQDEMKVVNDKAYRDHETTIKRLQNELQTLNSDIERQVIQRLNQRLLEDQSHNETIIKYQKEQQIFLEEQKDLRLKIEQLERDNLSLSDKLKKQDDEIGSLRYKIKQSEKKFKEEIDNIKKQKDEAQKKVDQLEKSKKTTSTTNNNSNTSKSMVTITSKTRNKNSVVQNKENVRINKTEQQEQNQDDEEKNQQRRQLALYRCQIKRLEIELKDVKTNSQKELNKLKDQLNCERKRRINIYEDKIEKNNQLLQDLCDKDQTIISLNRKISKLQEDTIQNNNRSLTPNHLQNSLQESIIQNILTQSMVEFNQGLFSQRNNSSKRLISPLRSLDLTLLNSNNVSFKIPLKNSSRGENNQKEKKEMTLSPKQIKRNRVNSVRIPTTQKSSSNGLNSSMNRIQIRTKGASIAEVNEDLYRDSVDSNHNEDDEIVDLDYNQINKSNIVIPYDKNQRLTYYNNNNKADEELREALLDDKTPRNDIYFDSLENQSSGVESLFLQSNRSQNNQLSCRVVPIQLIQEHKNPLQKSKNQRKKEQYDDEDCLVNILDQEDTNIEVQPTLMHTRQHLSTENFFKEISSSIENMQQLKKIQQQKITAKIKPQKNNNVQRNNNKLTNPLPKPYNTQSYHNKGVKYSTNLQDTYNKFEQFRTNNESNQKPNMHFGDHLMRSPSSPNLKMSLQSSGNENQLIKMDSCPSPLDETETIVLLGSGDKLRIKEVNQTKMDQYCNQFKDIRNKFSQTFKQPQSNKNQSTGDNQKFQFRTRTNSLVNSVCSEISLKMKFMPPQQQNEQKIKVVSHHNRIPSMIVNNQFNQKFFSTTTSPRTYQS